MLTLKLTMIMCLTSCLQATEHYTRLFKVRTFDNGYVNVKNPGHSINIPEFKQCIKKPATWAGSYDVCDQVDWQDIDRLALQLPTTFRKLCSIEVGYVTTLTSISDGYQTTIPLKFPITAFDDTNYLSMSMVLTVTSEGLAVNTDFSMEILTNRKHFLEDGFIWRTNGKRRSRDGKSIMLSFYMIVQDMFPMFAPKLILKFGSNFDITKKITMQLLSQYETKLNFCTRCTVLPLTEYIQDKEIHISKPNIKHLLLTDIHVPTALDSWTIENLNKFHSYNISTFPDAQPAFSLNVALVPFIQNWKYSTDLRNVTLMEIDINDTVTEEPLYLAYSMKSKALPAVDSICVYKITSLTMNQKNMRFPETCELYHTFTDRKLRLYISSRLLQAMFSLTVAGKDIYLELKTQQDPFPLPFIIRQSKIGPD